MNTNLEYYKVFYYVAKYGTISAAATMLNNSQPNLTRAVKNLENTLGCSLFFRTNKGMKLSPEGEKLYERLAVAFEQIELAEKEIESLKNMDSGFICVSVTEVALRCFLMPILKEFHTEHPNIQLRIGNQLTHGALEELKTGKVDLAVVTLPEDSDVLRKEETLSFTEITTIDEFAICSDQFADIANRTLDIRELVSFPLISLSDDTITYTTYRDFFAKYNICFSPEITAATADQILPLVESGLGIGFLPEDFIYGNKNIKLIKTAQPLPKRVLYLVKRKDKPISIASSTMEKFICN